MLSTLARTIVGDRQIAFLCLALSLLSISGYTLAQNQSSAEQPETSQTVDSAQQSAEQEKQQSTEENRQSSEEGDSLDSFVPSEGISEDLSVSFPVDI